MNIRNIAIGVIALLVIVIGGVFVAISMVDVNAYRGEIAEAAEQATGRKLVIAGEADLSVSLSPSISVSDVTFANAPWGSRTELAKLKDVSVEVALMPLISGDIQVKRLVLSGLDVLLETNDKGVGNWVFEGAEPGSGDADAGEAGDLPTVNLIVLNDINLTYRDGQSGATTKVAIARLEGRADSASSPLAFSLDAAYNSQPIKASGRLGPLAELADPDDPWPLNVKLAAGGADISVDGTIAKPMAADGLALKFSVNGKDLATLKGLAGAELPNLGPYTIAGNLSGNPDNLGVKGLTAKIGGSDVGGDVRVRMAGGSPSIEAQLKSTLLNVDDFTGGAKESAPAAKQETAAKDGKKRVFSADPLPLEGLSAVNADVSVAVGKLMASGLVLEDIGLGAKLKGGKADITLEKAKLSDGGLTGMVSVDGRKGNSGVAAKLNVAKVDIGRLLKEMEITDLLVAKLDAAVDVAGKGDSVRAIMAGLNGTMQAASNNGSVGSKYIDLLAADLLTSLVPGGPDTNDTKFKCLVTAFDIKKGIATNTALLFETEKIVIQGGGKINLQDETIDMQIKPKPKDASLLSLAVPIDIGGTLAEPSAGPNAGAVAVGVVGLAASAVNPLALLVPLVSAGSEDKNPCLTASAGGGKTAPAAAKKQPAPAKKKEEGGLGGVLKSILPGSD